MKDKPYDEWFLYYKDCEKNLKKIHTIVNSKNFKTLYKKIGKLEVWDDIIDVHFLSDIKNPEEFKEYFHRCQHTIKISSRKNNLVKIKNNNGKIRIPRLTVDKYDDLKYYNENTSRIETEFPLKHMVPKEFTEWEKEHLLT